MSSYHNRTSLPDERLSSRLSRSLPVDEWAGSPFSAHHGLQERSYEEEEVFRNYQRASDEFWDCQDIRMRSPNHTPAAPENNLLNIAAVGMKKDLQRFASVHIKTEPMPEEPMQPIMEDLPQLRYETSRHVPEDSGAPHIYFQVRRTRNDGLPWAHAPSDSGISLCKALVKDLDTLVDGQLPAPLDGASTKLSIRLLFEDCLPYNRQIMSRRSTRNSEPISRQVLAHKIAKEMKECLEITRDAGKPLKHRGKVVLIEELYLWRLRKVSPGSWVPEFKVMTWV